MTVQNSHALFLSVMQIGTDTLYCISQKRI